MLEVRREVDDANQFIAQDLMDESEIERLLLELNASKKKIHEMQAVLDANDQLFVTLLDTLRTREANIEDLNTTLKLNETKLKASNTKITEKDLRIKSAVYSILHFDVLVGGVWFSRGG